ncbi:MAG: glycosyltransferase family 4 protein [bacterium]|nr:glycosyltransferase family 4 protein [bacterium]
MESDNTSKFISRTLARKKLGISSDAFILGTISNLYKNKGLIFLVETTDLLLKKTPLSTVIIGEGPDRLEVEKIIKKKKLSNKVLLKGYISDAFQLLLAFDIYVCSSTKEGMPYAILEAMQAGLPIVSTNVGAIPEVIDDKKNGLLIEAKNPDLLAEKINYLIRHPDEMKRLGESAKEKVKQFSLEKMINETKNLYLE